MGIGDKLYKRRKELGLTLEEVGQVVGVGKSTVRKWETGDIENMRRDKIAKLAEALHTSPAFIMGWEESPETTKPATRKTGMPYSPTHRIPILGRISAGLPLYAEQHIEGYTYTELNHGGEYFALRVVGDSMSAARINEGDLLIIQRQDIVENGEVAVVLVGDEDATVKRFYQAGDTVTLMPQSYNSAHRPQVYDIRSTPIKVLGKVVECKISF